MELFEVQGINYASA